MKILVTPERQREFLLLEVKKNDLKKYVKSNNLTI